MEEFKIVFEDYEVSNFGNVRRKLKNGEYLNLKCSINNRGYKYFQLSRNKKRTNHLIHHLVAKIFIGERPEGLVIDHIDRNPLNNNICNLRYVSQTENMKNTCRYKTEIPDDVENRKSAVDKLWRENNKERCINNKKEYYEKNKEKICLKAKQDMVDIKCDECNEIRSITRSNYNRSKRLNVNICRSCSSKKNLIKANNILKML